ncbi:MAG: tRNA (N6-isopentenyl adenosine(37)-C2)-methylthiotransferase MiaB [Candidatus Eremiobacteraeota bacterium]|nr:tRNA (N6-isopentenyl adenosine(37)-C2)-methylthiotransferase MiaB [Candidatus Eremiobacteraeota bacterium]
MASIYIETFGCQMNEADSQFIAERATAAGYAIAEKPHKASVVLLNTCTVRDNAERRAYGRMQHFKTLKRADPGMKLVVTGCLAEQDRHRMRTIAPHVDAVFGTKELGELADALTAWRPGFVEDERSEERSLLLPMGGQADCIADAFTHLRAYVTVQRGCSYYCTFCIVPHVRGRFDHRPTGDILAEVRQRIAQGAREVTLVGQTVNAYKDPATGADFGDLLGAVAQCDGLERLSFLTSHPKDFTQKLVLDMARISRLNPRVHLPVQSASNPVLRRMNRKYTIEAYLEKVAFLREHLCGWALTTDIIVGFPGESEEDFQKTLALCATNMFTQAYMFIYSPRRGTPASHWPQVDSALASDRLRSLAAVQDRSCREFHQRKVGSVVRALVQGPSRKDPTKLAAKTVDNVTVVAPLPPTLDATSFAAAPWVDVRVEASYTWGATGTMLARSHAFTEPGTLVPSPTLDLITL